MRFIVLGSAAGGGFPQWNCGCPNCAAVRRGERGLASRTQDAVAVSARDGSFALLNASPDVLEQIKRTEALWPRAPRHSPLRAIVLTNGDMDHVAGLFSLRESYPLALYATGAVWRGLSANAMMRTLQRFEGHVVWRELPLDATVELADAAGDPIGVCVRAVAAPGKLPVHLVGHVPPSPEDNVGLVLSEAGVLGARTALYLTACARLEAPESFAEHDALLFDGTFFREDELVRLGLSRSVAKDMAHLPIGGEGGSLAKLGPLPIARKIYTHVNNTNPILGDTEERRAVEAGGFVVAHDGMEFTL